MRLGDARRVDRRAGRSARSGKGELEQFQAGVDALEQRYLRGHRGQAHQTARLVRVLDREAGDLGQPGHCAVVRHGLVQIADRQADVMHALDHWKHPFPVDLLFYYTNSQ
jgi:hypothetical protein